MYTYIYIFFSFSHPPNKLLDQNNFWRNNLDVFYLFCNGIIRNVRYVGNLIRNTKGVTKEICNLMFCIVGAEWSFQMFHCNPDSWQHSTKGRHRTLWNNKLDALKVKTRVVSFQTWH
jgi:hypothetical protein